MGATRRSFCRTNTSPLPLPLPLPPLPPPPCPSPAAPQALRIVHHEKERRHRDP